MYSCNAVLLCLIREHSESIWQLMCMVNKFERESVRSTFYITTEQSVLHDQETKREVAQYLYNTRYAIHAN